MKAVCRVEFLNRRRIVALLGRPPKGIPPIDVAALRFQTRRRPGRRDMTVYLTLDEAAWVITVLSQAIKRALSPHRDRFAREFRRAR